MINEKAGYERLEGNGLLGAGIGLREFSPASRSGGRVEIDRMDHDAILTVLEAHLDRVANAHPYEGTGNFAVEGPIVVRRFVVELADKLDSLQSTCTICAGRVKIGRGKSVGSRTMSGAVATSGALGPGSTWMRPSIPAARCPGTEQ